MNAFEDFYNDLLNEAGIFTIGTLEFLPSDILKALDPIAYNEGLLDFESYMMENVELESVK
jgi:hypothetical protein